MLKEEANKLAPVWLSMDQLLIEKNEKNEVRSIHSHSRRKSPSLNELLESYDFSRFASSSNDQALNDIFDLAIEWIHAVEKLDLAKGES